MSRYNGPTQRVADVWNSARDDGRKHAMNAAKASAAVVVRRTLSVLR